MLCCVVVWWGLESSHVLWSYDMGSLVDIGTDSVHSIIVLCEPGRFPVGVCRDAGARLHSQVFL